MLMDWFIKNDEELTKMKCQDHNTRPGGTCQQQ